MDRKGEAPDGFKSRRPEYSSTRAVRRKCRRAFLLRFLGFVGPQRRFNRRSDWGEYTSSDVVIACYIGLSVVQLHIEVSGPLG